MLADNFYVSLPSNAAKFPKNTQSNYTTVLESPIELIGKYQVALVEISNFSDFSISMGQVRFKNPFFGAIYENRKEFIDFNLRLVNGLTLKHFCAKLNFEIHNSFVREEFLFRQKLAFCTEANFISEMQALNDKKWRIERPILNVVKKAPNSYEVIDRIDSVFKDWFIRCNGTFDSQTQRFIFKNIELLREYFVLIVIRVPSTLLLKNTSYFVDEAFLIKSDYFLLDSSFAEKAWCAEEKREMSLEKFESPSEKEGAATAEATSIKAEEDYLNPSEFLFYLPYFKLLNSQTFKLETNYEITFSGLISQVLNNSEILNLVVKETKIFTLSPYLQLTKFILIYTNIIEPQFYAEKSSAILRTVNIKAKKSDNVIFYDNPHYLNLSQTRISSINIELKDTQGDYIEFNDKFSNVFISLHFRRIQ
jgi:hypothetical protein